MDPIWEEKKSRSGSNAKKLRAVTFFEFNLRFLENNKRITTGMNIWVKREDIN
jgi:hypothetical protein